MPLGGSRSPSRQLRRRAPGQAPRATQSVQKGPGPVSGQRQAFQRQAQPRARPGNYDRRLRASAAIRAAPGRCQCAGARRPQTTAEGLVYYSNRGGPGGFGYAICLQCGRAEADGDNRGQSPAQAAAPVTPELRRRQALPRRIACGDDRVLRRNIGERVRVGMRPDPRIDREACGAEELPGAWRLTSAGARI